MPDYKRGAYELAHAMDTSILMITFGRFLQFPKERLEALGLAGMLLDVGKTKLPDTILKKNDMLSPEELQCIGIYPVGGAVELNTGEVGIVIAQNLVRRLQPRVMVILDADWKPIHPQKILDLVKAPRTGAAEPYRIRRTLPKDKLPIDLIDLSYAITRRVGDVRS